MIIFMQLIGEVQNQVNILNNWFVFINLSEGTIYNNNNIFNCIYKFFALDIDVSIKPNLSSQFLNYKN